MTNPGILCSFHLMRSIKSMDQWYETLPAPLDGITVMGDSGAFSALHSGAPVTVDSYCRWLDTSTVLSHTPCLDVIGDPVATRLNWQEMRRRGYDTMPVVHGGAKIDVLQWYIDQGATYIALGGLVGAQSDRDRWIDRMMSVAYTQKVGLHGFGVTTARDMARWPWKSVDSSSWLTPGRYGLPHVFANGRMKAYTKPDLQKGRGIVEAQAVGYPIADIVAGQAHWTDVQRISWQEWSKCARHVAAVNRRREDVPWDFTLFFAGMSPTYLHNIFGGTSYRSDGSVQPYQKKGSTA